MREAPARCVSCDHLAIMYGSSYQDVTKGPTCQLHDAHAERAQVRQKTDLLSWLLGVHCHMSAQV